MSRLSFTLAASAMLVVRAFADDPATGSAAASKAAAAAAPAPIKIGSVTVTGSIRSRVESWDWFAPDNAQSQNAYTFSGNIFRLGFSQAHESWDWNLEFAVPFILGLPASPIAAGVQGQLGQGASYFAANNKTTNTGMIFAKQGYFRVKNLFGSPAQSIRVGRFEYSDGTETAPKNGTLAALKNTRISQRLIGPFGFTHVGRSFDGIHYVYNTPKNNFTFVGAVPTRGVFQTDGWGETNTAFGYAAYTKPWGSGTHTADTRVFALYYDDWRRITKTDSRPAAIRAKDLTNIRLQTYGAHSVHAFETASGTADLLLWGALQGGTWGTQTQHAHAVALEAGFQPKIAKPLKPWFRGGVFESSGDGNPNDGKHGTFFQALPTPRPFARFPFFNLMNNRDRMGAMILRPHPKWTVSSEFHALRLSNKNDFWYLGGGAFQPWTFGYTGRATNGALSLANLYDTNVEWRALKNFTVTGYYGFAQGRAVMQALYPKGKDGSLGYVEFTYKF